MKRLVSMTLVVVLVTSLATMVLPAQPTKADEPVWIFVEPGESIQEAIDAAIAAGGGTVELAQGIYNEKEATESDFIYIAAPEHHGQSANHTVSHLHLIGSGATLDDLGAWHNGETVSGSVLESPITIYEADYEVKVQGFGIFHKYHWNYSGIAVTASNPVISDCVIHYKREDGNGGGMTNLNASPTVNNTVFFDCHAQHYRERATGGAMYNDNSSPTLYNCMFLYNYTTSPPGSDLPGGGAISNEDSSVTLINCTLGYNLTNQSGGGIYNDGGSSSTLVNCIMWGNRKGVLYGEKVLDNISGSANVTYSDIEGGWDGEDNIDEEPMFVDTEWEEPDDWLVDFRLLPDSPCIDTGNDEAVLGLPDEDFEGDPRIFGEKVDMGADEYVPETELVAATVDIKPDTLNLGSKGRWIMAYIELPEGYDVTDIEITTILLEDSVPAEESPTNVGDYDNDGIPDLMVKFDRQEVIEELEWDWTTVYSEEITITLNIDDGTAAEGSDTIKVLPKEAKGKGKGKKQD